MKTNLATNGRQVALYIPECTLHKPRKQILQKVSVVCPEIPHNTGVVEILYIDMGDWRLFLVSYRQSGLVSFNHDRNLTLTLTK